jgi:membrane-bound inhibitor of C-type lysozyme
MGIDVAPATVAWILFIISASSFAYLIGGFVYWNKGEEQIKQLNKDLTLAYREADEVREAFNSCACRSKRKPSAGR